LIDEYVKFHRKVLFIPRKAPKITDAMIIVTVKGFVLIRYEISIMGAPNRDSSVGIATGCGLDDRGVGFRVPVGSRIFSIQIVSRAHPPPIQRVLGVKRQGREAEHSPSASAEVKKMWIYTSTPPYSFMT
jgi:hypothetical protein